MPKAYDQSKTKLLTEARENAGLTQVQAAEYFGLIGTKGRDAIRDWEYGRSLPKIGRRQRFVLYLREKLGLKDNPEQMRLIWREVMVGLWKWPELTESELPEAIQSHVIREKSEIYKVIPNQIPAPTSDFVGRDDEVKNLVSQIQDAVSSEKVALCAIRGMGGVGKTELAYKVTQQVMDLFPGGQVVVELGGEGLMPLPPAHALGSIIRALEPNIEIPTTETEQELIARYRSVLTHRRVFILADNARDTAQVRPLVPAVGCVLLVTSRRHISLKGSNIVPLEVLQMEAAVKLLLDICPSIGTHAPELAQVCGFLPLALRISASLLDATPMTVGTFLEQLSVERLSLLVGPEENPDDPQASVEASLRLSFNALDEGMKQVVTQLSVFPESFTLEAAKAVVQGVDSVQEAVGKLYRRSLVEWQKANDRYTLHDLVREFCEMHLVDGEAVQIRLVRYYLTVIANIKRLYGSEDSDLGLALYDREQANLEKGWVYACAHSGETDTDTLLLDYIYTEKIIAVERHRARIDIIPRIIAALVAEQRLKREHIALFLLWLGVTFADASEDWHFQQESRPALMYNDPVHASSLYMWWDELEYLIDSFWDADKADNTINSLQQSLEILRGEGVAEAECLGVLGFFYSSKGEAYNAFISWQQSIVFARAVGSQHIECASLFVLGYAYMKMNQIQQASECFEQSLTVAQKFGATSRRVLASWDFSDVLLQCSETEGSIKLMQVWMEFKRSFNDASVAKMERS